MFDRIFLAALTLCLQAAGTLAIVSAMLGLDRPATQQAQAQTRVVRHERVEIVARRVPPGTAVAKSDGTQPAHRNIE